MKLNSRHFALCFVLLGFVFCVSFAEISSADSPQWRGPNRDGHAAPQSLLKSWPDGGPELLWSAKDLGAGYSAASIVGDQLFTLGSKDGECKLICLSPSTGQSLWESTVGRAGNGDDYNVGWGAGQRSTPTVDGDQVFVVSDVGTVASFDRQNGAMQWKIEMVADYGGEIPTWGYSESALIDGQRVLVTPGGENFMIGLDRSTGEKVWSSQGVDAPAQYVSIMKGVVGERDYYVTGSNPGLFAFDVLTGEKLFQDTATRNKVAVIPTPILTGNQLYHTSAYGAGNTLLDLTMTGEKVDVKSVYALTSKTMENHHGGVVLVDGVIYGFTKQSRGNWMAQDLATGETLWTERVRPNRSGSICYADGMLYCYGDVDGTVSLVHPDRSEFRLAGKLTLPAETTMPRDRGAIWAHPVVANGKLVIRDQDLIYAYDIRNKAEAK